MPKKFKRHQAPTFASDARHRRYDVKRYADGVLGPVARFRGTQRWKDVRHIKISKNPTCEGHHSEPVLARHVHHVIALQDCLQLGQLERLGSHELNLRSLCVACHDRVERDYDKDRWGAITRFIDQIVMQGMFEDCGVSVILGTEFLLHVSKSTQEVTP